MYADKLIDEYDVDNDLRIGSTSSLPWSGIVLTFTGVEGKTELGKMVRSLGGVVETALTIKVTHVIAKGFGSPKYLVSWCEWLELTGSMRSIIVFRCCRLAGSWTLTRAGSRATSWTCLL